MDASSRSIPAAQFRDQCLRLMDEVRATGETLIVTKHGRPVAAVVSYVEQAPKSIIGWSDDIDIGWDPEELAVPPERWQALSDPDGARARTLCGAGYEWLTELGKNMVAKLYKKWSVPLVWRHPELHFPHR